MNRLSKSKKKLIYTKALTEPEVYDYKYFGPPQSNHIDITPVHADIILTAEITANSSIDPLKIQVGIFSDISLVGSRFEFFCIIRRCRIIDKKCIMVLEIKAGVGKMLPMNETSHDLITINKDFHENMTKLIKRETRTKDFTQQQLLNLSKVFSHIDS
ncbi:hypothetical protein RIR_jg2277.t1 [Rhizophagus irregularis DAOM 181602=DAOM 197198]|nr:hypothetical protein RIR_jg2277.t1 [Rhizophagus irregularis DAOM 181602=DAOM 197198]